MTNHPAIAPGRVAVVTGGASGIGLAAAKRFAGFGMKVAIADLHASDVDQAAREIRSGSNAEVLGVRTDVGVKAEVENLKERVYSEFGEVAVLMNNAGTGNGGGPFDNYDGWQRVIATNLWGVINGVQTFAEAMIAQGTDAAIVNTGSKQGITTPPGDTAYNVSKAGVKVLTEGLQHVLRNTPNCKVTAHLLIPGWTFTGLTARDGGPKPAGAWTPDQVIDRMLEATGRGDFYILCPDNEVTTEVDRKRVLWAAGDLAENRPPLSRWHADYAEAFKAFLSK